MLSRASRIRRITTLCSKEILSVECTNNVLIKKYESSSDEPMFLFLNVKNRRETIGFRVVVMVQWLAHLTCNPGDAGSIPTHGIMCLTFKRDQ